jgi:excisionase family DNA binding protein
VLILSPEERANLWLRAATTHDHEERERLLEQVASSALEESLRSKFDLYGDLGDRFVDSVLVLAEADRLLDNDMLRRFQAIAIDERGGDRFFSAVIARLGEVAEDPSIAAGLRARAGEYYDYWRDHAPSLAEELYSIEEVARQFFVSKAAVYRWIKAGKLAARRTPGGGIIGVYASELAGSTPAKELSHLAVAEATRHRTIESGVKLAYESVLADIAAGRTKEIPARRYDPNRAEALERAEELASAQSPTDGYETDYPEGFVRRGGFGRK